MLAAWLPAAVPASELESVMLATDDECFKDRWFEVSCLGTFALHHHLTCMTNPPPQIYLYRGYACNARCPDCTCARGVLRNCARQSSGPGHQDRAHRPRIQSIARSLSCRTCNSAWSTDPAGSIRGALLSLRAIRFRSPPCSCAQTRTHSPAKGGRGQSSAFVHTHKRTSPAM